MDDTRIAVGATGGRTFRPALTGLVALSAMAVLGPAPAAEPSRDQEAAKDAIVKIYTVVNNVDWFRPWNSSMARSGGSGCVISGNRILTNAHVVANQVRVEVRRHGRARRHTARLLNVSHQVDLALLTVDDETFFDGIDPLDLGELPRMQEEVLVYGFPMGGDTLSVTKGVVSRIEHNHYTHSGEFLLAGQVDAAINPGNSGGPVIAEGKIGGVVMQVYKSADNIGYMVPVPVIRHFFKDLEDGSLGGVPALGLIYQPMENPGMRRRCGMGEDRTGVQVRHIFPNAPVQGICREGDVILTIDGHEIADDGTVEFRPKERTALQYHVHRRQMGETTNLRLLRESEELDVTVTLGQPPSRFRLVQLEQYDALPPYFIYGGIVFTPLTKNLLSAWGGNWMSRAPRDLVFPFLEWPTEEKTEVVVATQVLAADVNKGYHHVSNFVVDRVNGKRFRDFREFYRIVAQCRDPFLVLTNDREYELVIDTELAAQSHADILRLYRIPADRSEDLMALTPAP